MSQPKPAPVHAGDPAQPWWEGRALWIAIGVLIAIFAAIGWLWYPAFLGARVPGPYWLMIVLAQNAFRLVGLLVGGVPLIFMLRGLWFLIRALPGRAMLWRPVMASFTAGVLLFPAGFPILLQPLAHVETLQAADQTLQMGEVTSLDAADYVLYACDPSGGWCSQVWYSSHFVKTTARLQPDPSTGDVAVLVCDATTGGSDCQPKFTYHPDR